MKQVLSTEKEAMAKFQTSHYFKLFSGLRFNDGDRAKEINASIAMTNEIRWQLTRGIIAAEELFKQTDSFDSDIDIIFQAFQASRM